jgi:two-component system OmpR family response regulator
MEDSMKKVLIVDDTKNIRTLLTTCLELRDYEVFEAEDGKSALDLIKIKKNEINLIFLDIRMPQMSGTEVLKAIRDIGINCPVIIMTAYATVKNAIDCTKLGAVAYLQKPFSPDRVNSVLEEIFNQEDEYENLCLQKKSEDDFLFNSKILINEGKYMEAHESLKMALARDPYCKEVYYLLGEVNEKMNNSEEAKRFYSISKLF